MTTILLGLIFSFISFLNFDDEQLKRYAPQMENYKISKSDSSRISVYFEKTISKSDMLILAGYISEQYIPDIGFLSINIYKLRTDDDMYYVIADNDNGEGARFFLLRKRESEITEMNRINRELPCFGFEGSVLFTASDKTLIVTSITAGDGSFCGNYAFEYKDTNLKSIGEIPVYDGVHGEGGWRGHSPMERATAEYKDDTYYVTMRGEGILYESGGENEKKVAARGVPATYFYDGNRWRFIKKSRVSANLSSITISGYTDVISINGSSCHIRIIVGEKIYSGIITFSRLSTLTKQRINNYEDAVRVLSGRQVKVILSGVKPSAGNASAISFGNITQITFLVNRTTKQTAQTWNERTTNKETIIELSTDILFDFDKATIKPEAVPTLIKLARLIRQSSNNLIQLNGFTDSKGTDEYNLDLSERRAEAVKQWLVTKGSIEANRLQIKGYGESQPVAPNTNQDGSDDPVGRQKNRRVEVRIPRN